MYRLTNYLKTKTKIIRSNETKNLYAKKYLPNVFVDYKWLSDDFEIYLMKSLNFQDMVLFSFRKLNLAVVLLRLVLTAVQLTEK